MGKARRGEVGVFATDPENAWRFSDEGCLRQFVTVMARDKNELVDTSAARYAGPIKAYLRALGAAEGGQGIAGKPIERGGVATRAFEQTSIKPPSSAIPVGRPGSLVAALGRWKQRVSALKRSWPNRFGSVKLAEAKQAWEQRDWPRVERLGKRYWKASLTRRHSTTGAWHARAGTAAIFVKRKIFYVRVCYDIRIISTSISI
jgi:hypothetical protein